MCSLKWTRIYRIALEATATSSQVQAAVYLRIKRACESAPVLLFPSLPGGNSLHPQPNPINWTPPPILLHPANTNTPSSHWKTSVFWGQAQGSTSNLPQWSHMKHLEAGQGKQGRKELGFCSRGGGWRLGAGGIWTRARSKLVDDFLWGWKRPLWVQCAQLH